MFSVSEESKRRVYEMFDRNEKTADEDVETIKIWMKSQLHLPELMDDVKIKNFLNIQKYSIEKTKQKIDNYYTIRGLIPELFTQCNPKLENMQKALDMMYVTMHPKTVDGIHRVWFIAPKAPNQFSLVGLIKLMFCIIEVRLYEDFLCSDIFVVDMGLMTMTDMKNYASPSLLAKRMTATEKMYSLRINAVHYINSPNYVSTFLSILKNVMKPKIFDRVHVHQDSKVLNELFLKDDLPKDYGGDGPSLNELNEMTRQKLLKYQERFDVLDNLRVDESLRPEKLDNDNILGYYGNFKKIDVD